MTRVIVVTAGKGGVTKTTGTVNLAYELSKKGEKVCIFDFDQQGDVSKFCKRTNTEFFVGDVLMDHKFDVRKAIYPAIIGGEEQENLHVVTGRSRDEMIKLDMNMMALSRREDRLKIQLDKIDGEYDYIIIDTSPSSSVIGLNAIVAGTDFLLPTDFTEHSIEGVESILEHIQDVRMCEEEDINYRILPSKLDRRTKTIIEYGKEYFADRSEFLSSSVIWAYTVFPNAEKAHEPVSVFDKSHVAARYYKELAMEYINE